MSHLKISDISIDVKDILKQRGHSYGPFRDHAHKAQRLKDLVFDNFKYDYQKQCVTNDTITEGLEMILHKIARISNGDPYYLDNWVDIAGYAQLVIAELSLKR